MKEAKRPAARKAAGRKGKPVMKARPKRAPKSAAARPGAPALKRQYIDLFKKEFPTTVKVLKAFPPGKDDFRPHERSHSAARLVHTFAMENVGAARVARGEPLDPAALPRPPATYAEAVAAYERGAAELIAAVEEMPDSRLSDEVKFFTGPGQMGNVPVLDVLWFMLMDSIHHRGQLSVYVRMAGGKVPSIYGPSADEPWR